MTKNIRMVLMPFLIISYIVGLRIVISNHSKLWFSVTYMLLVWSVYFLSSCALITSFNEYNLSDNQYSINIYVENFITILSIVFGIYQDKKYQNCLKKFDIIDNTLLKLGTITDYDNLRKKRIWCVLGWIFIVILSMYYSVSLLKDKCDGDIVLIILYAIQKDYCLHINFITDLINASLLQYTGLKFDEINEHLRNLMKNQKHEIIRAWENPQIYHHQHRFSKPLSNKCITWIIIHLYLELRKISSDINSIFGIQMTTKIACYFIWIIIDLYELFNTIFIDNYKKSKIMAIILLSFYLSHHIFQFLLINYMCETVSTKANATANLLNRLSCTTYDVEIRETISQFLLRIVHAPLRFYGMGLFQFGFKFLYKFITSLATVLVIIIQAQANK